MNKVDELRAFAEVVSRMRLAQVKYFQSRTNANLNEAKKLEKEVDARLKTVAPASAAIRDDIATQGRLFG